MLRTKPKPKAAWKMIIFYKGKRIEKLVYDQKKGIETYRELKARGIKVCFVSRVRGYWPKTDDPGPENPDMLWCPYCRTWRWFSIPSIKLMPDDVVVNSEEFFDVLYRRVLNSSVTPWCQWCHISLADFEVRRMNDLWGWAPKRRRSTRRRPTNRRRTR